MTFRPQAGTRKAIHFVSNPGGLPDCADLADLRVCSAEDSKDDVGTIHRSAQSAFPSATPECPQAGRGCCCSAPSGRRHHLTTRTGWRIPINSQLVDESDIVIEV